MDKIPDIWIIYIYIYSIYSIYIYIYMDACDDIHAHRLYKYI